MKNKLYLFFLITVLLISFCSSEIILSQNPMNISQKINENHTYQISITNTYNFSVMDFGFSNLESKGFSFLNITIPANTTQTYDFYVKTSVSSHENIDSTVSFKYIVNLPDEITTKNIIIAKYSGFSETYVTIKQGDTITWFNTDTITYNLESNIFGGTISIPPNESRSFTFNNLGTFHYSDPDYDIYNNYNGIIEVLNRTSEQKAHNPNNDVTWTIVLNSFLNPTNLTTSNSGDNYTIEYTKFKKGALTITNNGNETAEIVHLSSSSDWITFDKNDFNIQPGDVEPVGYTIYPTFLTTNGTNKEYTPSISIRASNTEEQVLQLSIFIPYKEIVLGAGNQNDLEYYSSQFCPKNPCAPICMALLGYPSCSFNGTSGAGVGSDNLTLNVTSQSWYDTQRDISALKTEVSSIRSTNNEKASNDQQTEAEQTKMQNESLALQKRNEIIQRQRTNTIWWVGSIIFIIFICGLVIDSEHKKKFGRSLIGDVLNFKKI